jgi:hypothetical protein
VTHPITPPQELLQEWCQQGRNCISELDALKELATQAARWGADQELEAFCALLYRHLPGYEHSSVDYVRAARRPKPPLLKEQALAELNRLIALIPTEGALAMAEPIRCALEALPND